ncbi:MAG TPA: 1,4-dihydroxy-2-naphthoate polyprenyltransferase [Candidatus Nanopelagicaceae bacterium]|nr:1,4-dihydroxy-2-naphthoate polyprenyltransferase [Candidatus Nanopelagicaceae bacterium]
MATAKQWVSGARPRTLPAAFTPVAVGTGASFPNPRFATAGLALIVALSLQIAVNYANDYSDGIKGTDDERVGPFRLVGSKTATARSVLLAAVLFFLIAAAAGLILAAMTSWWLIPIGMAAIAAAWGYTGGSNPYGYRALGELSVFVFFGVVAVTGTYFVQRQSLNWWVFLASLPIGLLACALLTINNLRDIPNDRLSGKRTLAVVLDDRKTRILYYTLVASAYLTTLVLSSWRAGAALALLTTALFYEPLRKVRLGAAGRQLIPVLVATARIQLLFGLLLSMGLAITF